MNSPQSQRLTVGSRVSRYTIRAMRKEAQPSRRLSFLKSIGGEFTAFFPRFLILSKMEYIWDALNPKYMTSKAMNDLDLTLYTDYPEFEHEYANKEEPLTLPPEKQTLIVGLDKRRMDGAPITYISGFVGRRIDLLRIEDELEGVCHTCGSSKMYDIMLNGDVRKRAYVYLRNRGYMVRFAEN
jgi:translation initiation factor 1 (eIF-1/SUI1)